MRTAILSLGILALVSSFAMAGDLNLYWDVRDNAADILTPTYPFINTSPALGGGNAYAIDNGGGKGDGQIVFVAPKTSGNEHIYNGFDGSQAHINLYADFAGSAGEVVSSLGIDMTGAYTAGTYLLEDTAFVFESGLWDGTAISTAFDATGTGGFKAVQVPVTSGPAFDSTVGIKSGDEAVKIGRLDIQAADRGTADYGSGGTLEIKMGINNLLCTRVNYPTAAGTMTVSLGYAGGSPEAAVSGIVVGGANAAPDITVIIKMKGDFLNFGTVDFGGLNSEIDAINLAENPTQQILNPDELFSADFDGTGDFNLPGGMQDYIIDFGDLNGFLANLVVPEEG